MANDRLSLLTIPHYDVKLGRLPDFDHVKLYSTSISVSTRTPLSCMGWKQTPKRMLVEAWTNAMANSVQISQNLIEIDDSVGIEGTRPFSVKSWTRC